MRGQQPGRRLTNRLTSASLLTVMRVTVVQKQAELPTCIFSFDDDEVVVRALWGAQRERGP